MGVPGLSSKFTALTVFMLVPMHVYKLPFQGGDLADKITAWRKSGKTFDESLIVVWLIQLFLAIQFVHKK